MRRYWRPFFQVLPWLLFLIWFLLATFFLVRLIIDGTPPVDFGTYQQAADALRCGDTPYQTPEQSRRIWLAMHQFEQDVLAGQPVASEGALSGPYVYPPTLALLIAQLNLNALWFVVLNLFAVYGFGWLWLQSTHRSGWWLLLIVGSWDVLAAFLGGNIELLLLAAALGAAWLLWHQQGLWAVPLIALTVLIKPFYGLFFIAFGLLLVAGQPAQRVRTLRSLAGTAAVALLLIGLDVYRWGPELQAEAGRYLMHAREYLWFDLPTSEQTPMSIWNRSLLQGLINVGFAADTAQWIALGLWLVIFVITLWRVWGRQLTFPVTFALAFVLLYLGRSITWGLPYLEIVVLLAAWPVLGRWQRGVLLGATLVLMASHWWALSLTLQGTWVRLFTLQGADLPWETWTIVPLCWALLMIVVPQLTERPMAEKS